MLKIIFLGILQHGIPLLVVLLLLGYGGDIIDFIKNKIRDHKRKGYGIITDGVMQSSIIESECQCPNCGCESGEVNDKRPIPNHHQYVYCCRNCGTVWQGNIYDMQFRKKK